MGGLNSHFHNEFMDIIQEVNMHARNEFVQQYVDIPPVPLIRMQVLFLFLYDSGVAVQEIKNFIIPTLMVQMGLDCHQEVTLFSCEDEREIRKKQLTVLAGDYFSGKYYQLLARIKNVELIRSLSGSICKINEWKTELYCNQNLRPEERLDVQNQVDSALFVSFVETGGISDGALQPTKWQSLMRSFIQVERSMDELLSYRWGNIVKGYLLALSQQHSIQKAVSIVHKQIEEQLANIQSLSNDVTNKLVREEISFMVQENLQKVSSNPIKAL